VLQVAIIFYCQTFDTGPVQLQKGHVQANDVIKRSPNLCLSSASLHSSHSLQNLALPLFFRSINRTIPPIPQHAWSLRASALAQSRSCFISRFCLVIQLGFLRRPFLPPSPSQLRPLSRRTLPVPHSMVAYNTSLFISGSSICRTMAHIRRSTHVADRVRRRRT
jgi:hypothetical protein